MKRVRDTALGAAADEEVCYRIAQMADDLLRDKEVHRRYVAHLLTHGQSSAVAFAEQLGELAPTVCIWGFRAGLPLTELRRHVWLTRACAMLSAGCTVEVIALRLGYASPNTARNMLVRWTGMTVSRWRRARRVDEELAALAEAMRKAAPSRLARKPLPQWRKAG